MATVPTVADNALILTDWGNLVAAECNNSVKKTLAQVMAAGSSLTAPILAISTNQLTTAPASNHAIRSDYAAANFVSANGDTIFGQVILAPQTTNQCLILRTNATGAAANLPYVSWSSYAGTRFGYIQGTATEMRVFSDGFLVFYENGVERMRLSGGHLLVGQAAPSSFGDAGVAINVDGQTHITTTGAGQRNLNCGHIGDADVAGSQWIRFSRTTSGTNIGAITQVGTSGTNYGEGSDRRMKTILGPVPDPVERVRALTPYRVSWNDDDQRDDSDAFIADEVDELVPGAVVGEPDAVDAEGDPAYQMLDYSKVVPLLTAALQTALDKIDALETRVAELEAA